MSFENIYRTLNKRAAEMLTPQAQQAAMQPPPQAPAAMGGMPPQGAPMDPAMTGAPAGAPPMDPSMMPPQGAPTGQPAAWMQDPMFMQFLQQMGAQVQPDGSVLDPSGQSVPPEAMEQLYAQFQQQMAAQGGAPTDPAMAGGMPQQGMPQQGMPQEAMMEQPAMQLPEEVLNQVAGVVQQVVDATIEQKIAALDKKLTAFTDKIDAIKMLLDDILVDNAKADKEQAAQGAKLDAEIENDLANAQAGEAVEIQPTEEMLAQQAPQQGVAQGVPNMLDIMRGNA